MFKQLRKKNNIRRNTTRVYIFRNRKQRFFLVNCTNSRSSRKEGTMGTCLICGTDSAALILRTSWTVEMINARCRDELTPRRSAAKLFAKASRCSCIFNKLDPVSSQDPREASSRHFSLSLSFFSNRKRERTENLVTVSIVHVSWKKLELEEHLHSFRSFLSKRDQRGEKLAG